jgi:endonuclease/exonuclease/phosphatase (EEP) superfamily protein YafD
LKAAVTAVVCALGAATLLSFLDGLSWFFELGTFFRFQYAVLLGTVASVAICLRLFRHFAAGLALAAVNLAVIAPIWLPAPDPALVSEDRVRVLLVNVEAGNDRYADVARLIEQTRPDVVGINELTPAWAEGLAAVLRPYGERSVAPQPDAYGIGLYSRIPLLSARIERFPADGPPSVVAAFEIGDRPVTLVLTHVHTPFAGSVHARQYEALAEARGRLGDRLAICGDLNAVPWAAPVRRLAAAAGLSDSTRGRGLEYSWPSWNPLLAVPIDNCLVSDGVDVVERRSGPDVGSDHFPVVVELGITALAERAAHP